MVAVRGSGWVLAPCLDALIREADKRWPRRSTRSDGSIGDQSHANRTSDHNPQSGFVCAVDLTHDPANGVDAHKLARQVAAARDPRVKYIISNGQMCRSYAKPGVPAWSWSKYTGSNAHTQHAHFSVNNTATARNNVSPWFPGSVQSPIVEEDTVMNPAQERKLDRLLEVAERMRPSGDIKVDGKWGNPMYWRIEETVKTVRSLTGQVGALSDVVSQLAGGSTVIDYKRVQEAAEAAVREFYKDATD